MKKLIETLEKALPRLIEIDKVVSEIESMKKQRTDLEIRIAYLLEQIEINENLLSSTKQLVDSEIKRQHEEIEKEKSEWSNKFKEMDEKSRARANDAAVQASLAHEKSESSRKILSDVSDANKKLAEREKVCLDKENELKKLKESLEESRRTSADAISKKEETLSLLQGRLSAKEKELNKIEENLNKEKKDVELATKNINDANSAMMKEREEFLRHSTEIESKVKEAEKTIEKANIRWVVLNKVGKDLEKKEADLNALRKSIDDKEKSVMALQKELEKR
jgi:DNA repair exonuclease SbcCD ATPase subunit